MKKWFLRKWFKFRLKNLNEKHVKYVHDDQQLLIRKGLISVTLKAVYIPATDKDPALMQISGNHIVVENDVVEAIWSVLWSRKITDDIKFCDVKVLASPNFLYIRKEEVIPID